MVFVLALVLRVVFVAATTITPISDAERYIEHARRLSEGLGFTSAEGIPTAYTPPGYPVFVAFVQAIFGTDTRAVAYVQALLGAICCVLTLLVCDRLFDRRHAVLAGLMCAVSPTSIVYAGEVLSEVPTTLALVGVLLLIADRRESGGRSQQGFLGTWAAGVLLGTAALFRPAVMAWGLGLGFYLLLFQAGTRSRRLLEATALAIGVAVAVSPWTLRNYRLYQALVPISTNGGYNLYLGNNPQAWGGGWMPLEDELRDQGEFAGEKEARRRAMIWIHDNPVSYAKVSLRRALQWISAAPDYAPGIRLTSTPEIDEAIVLAYRGRSTGQTAPEPPAFQRSKRLNWSILFLWSFVTIPLSLVGIVLDVSRRPRWLLLLPLISYAAALNLTFMQTRFREVVLPVLLIYAAVGAWGLVGLRESWQSASRTGRRVLLLGLPLMLLLFCFQLVRDRDVIAVVAGW